MFLFPDIDGPQAAKARVRGISQLKRPNKLEPASQTLEAEMTIPKQKGNN
jgi:hypothetical protein